MPSGFGDDIPVGTGGWAESAIPAVAASPVKTAAAPPKEGPIKQLFSQAGAAIGPERVGQAGKQLQQSGHPMEAFGTGFVQGLEETGASIADPTNLAIIGLDVFGGRLISAAPKVARLVRVVRGLGQAGFTAEMFKGLAEDIPQAYEAAQSGDYTNAGRYVARTLAEGGLGVHMARGAIKPAINVAGKVGRVATDPDVLKAVAKGGVALGIQETVGRMLPWWMRYEVYARWLRPQVEELRRAAGRAWTGQASESDILSRVKERGGDLTRDDIADFLSKGKKYKDLPKEVQAKVDKTLEQMGSKPEATKPETKSAKPPEEPPTAPVSKPAPPPEGGGGGGGSAAPSERALELARQFDQQGSAKTQTMAERLKALKRDPRKLTDQELNRELQAAGYEPARAAEKRVGHRSIEQIRNDIAKAMGLETPEAQTPAAAAPSTEQQAKIKELEKKATKKVEPSTTATPPPEGWPAFSARLSGDLAGAKPRYSYRDANYELKFDSDIDKASYITAQKVPSKRDADYLKFVYNKTGWTDEQIRSHGAAIKESLKARAGAYSDAPRQPEWISVPDSIYVDYVDSGDVKSALLEKNQRGAVETKSAPPPKEEPAKHTSEQDATTRYQQAVALVREAGKASTSTLQRKMGVKYEEASKLLERMESEGIIGPAVGSRPRELLSQAESKAPTSRSEVRQEPEKPPDKATTITDHNTALSVVQTAMNAARWIREAESAETVAKGRKQLAEVQPYLSDIAERFKNDSVLGPVTRALAKNIEGLPSSSEKPPAAKAAEPTQRFTDEGKPNENVLPGNLPSKVSEAKQVGVHNGIPIYEAVNKATGKSEFYAPYERAGQAGGTTPFRSLPAAKQALNTVVKQPMPVQRSAPKRSPEPARTPVERPEAASAKANRERIETENKNRDQIISKLQELGIVNKGSKAQWGKGELPRGVEEGELEGRRGLTFSTPDGQKWITFLDDPTQGARLPKTVQVGNVKVPEEWTKGTKKAEPATKSTPPPKEAAKPEAKATAPPRERGSMLEVQDKTAAQEAGLDTTSKYRISGRKGDTVDLVDDSGALTQLKATPAEVNKIFGEGAEQPAAKSATPPEGVDPVSRRAAEQKLQEIGVSNSFPAYVAIYDAAGKEIDRVAINNASDLKTARNELPGRISKNIKDAKMIGVEIPGMKTGKSFTNLDVVRREVEASRSSGGVEDIEETKRRIRKSAQRGSLSFSPTDGTALSEDIARVGRSLYAKARDFNSWATQMLQELGARIRPYLKRIWDAVLSSPLPF